MATTVVGLYDDYETAKKVVKALKDRNLNSDNIHLIAHDERHTSSRYDTSDLHRHLVRDGVPEDDAELYAEGVRRGGSLVVVEAPDDRSREVADIMNGHRPVDIEDRRASWSERGYTGHQPDQKRYTEEEVKAERKHTREREAQRRPKETKETEQEAHMTEAHEELHVGKREVSGGGVRLHKRVKERPVEEKVRLHEEEVDVEKRPASKTSKTTGNGDVFKEETVEFTERREEPVVKKETHIEGEVVARKKEREREETVRDTVRETEVDVEKKGKKGTGTRARGLEDFADAFRKHHRETYDEGDYSTYEPAYRFGHRYGTHKDYSDRDWNELQPEIRRDYEAQHGKGTFEDVKEAVRYGFSRPRTTTTR